MTSKAVTFYGDSQTSAILATIEKGKASRFINEAIRFYKVYGVNHERSSILDLNDLYSHLLRLRAPSHFENELTATLARFLKNAPVKQAVEPPVTVFDFRPPTPAQDPEELPVWKELGYESEEAMDAHIAQCHAEEEAR